MAGKAWLSATTFEQSLFLLGFQALNSPFSSPSHFFSKQYVLWRQQSIFGLVHVTLGVVGAGFAQIA